MDGSRFSRNDSTSKGSTSGLEGSRFGGKDSGKDGNDGSLGKPISVRSFEKPSSRDSGGSTAGRNGNDAIDILDRGNDDSNAGRGKDDQDLRDPNPRRDGEKGSGRETSDLQDAYRKSFGDPLDRKSRDGSNVADGSKENLDLNGNGKADKVKFGGKNGKDFGSSKKFSFKDGPKKGAKWAQSKTKSWHYKGTWSYHHHSYSFWKFNCSFHFGWWYYPKPYWWYGSGFGFHPVYSSYWWCEWWPSYVVYPRYVSYVPTYYPVYDTGTDVVNYYNYYDGPPEGSDGGSAPPPAEGAPSTEGAVTPTGDIPKEQVDPDFEKELQQFSQNESAMSQLQTGVTAFRNRDYLGASDAFRKAMLAERNNSLAKFAMANAQFALGEYGYASFLIRRAMELRPNWPWIGSDLRDMYSEPDDLEEQRLALDSFITTHPDDVDAKMLQGYVAFFSGDIEAAESAFDAVLEKQPVDSIATAFKKRIGEVKELLEKDGLENAPPTGSQPAAPTEGSKPQDSGSGAPPAPAQEGSKAQDPAAPSTPTQGDGAQQSGGGF